MELAVVRVDARAGERLREDLAVLEDAGVKRAVVRGDRVRVAAVVVELDGGAGVNAQDLGIEEVVQVLDHALGGLRIGRAVAAALAARGEHRVTRGVARDGGADEGDVAASTEQPVPERGGAVQRAPAKVDADDGDQHVEDRQGGHEAEDVPGRQVHVGRGTQGAHGTRSLAGWMGVRHSADAHCETLAVGWACPRGGRRAAQAARWSMQPFGGRNHTASGGVEPARPPNPWRTACRCPASQARSTP